MSSSNFITKEDIKKDNLNQLQISDHSYRILIIGGSGSRKRNALLNLINHDPDIDEIYSDAKDPYKAKYQLLINKRESTRLKYSNDSKLLLSIQMIWLIFIKY